jgi:hypothetical protein
MFKNGRLTIDKPKPPSNEDSKRHKKDVQKAVKAMGGCDKFIYKNKVSNGTIRTSFIHGSAQTWVTTPKRRK